MGPSRAARLTRRTGIDILPIIVYVAVAVLAGGGIFAADYFYRKRQDAANKPAPPEVIGRNLVENIIGKDTVKESKFDPATSTMSITFESATFKPEQPKKQSQEFLEAEAELASQAVLMQMQQVKKLELKIVYKGATLATATAPSAQPVDKTPKASPSPGKVGPPTPGVTITYVDPRLK